MPEVETTHELGSGIKRSFRDNLPSDSKSVSDSELKQYKHTINQSCLVDFFDLSIDLNHRPDIVKAVNQVILIVVIKHYSHGYEDYEEDFKSWAWYAAMDRRKKQQYDKSMSAYNYLYTLFRNEIGNLLRKFTREQVGDVGELLRDATNPETKAEFPPEIDRYIDDLATGDFTIMRIPQKDVLPLLLFLSRYDKSRSKVPQFIDNGYNPIMYNLLKKLLDE